MENVSKQRAHIKSAMKCTLISAFNPIAELQIFILASTCLNFLTTSISNLSSAGANSLNSKNVSPSNSVTGIINLEVVMFFAPFSLQQEKEHC